jgi:hypothetical protein
VGSGVQLGPLGTAATNRPIVPATGDYDNGEIGGMMIGRGNRSTRRKPALVLLGPPQSPHAARTRIRAAAVGSQRLTLRATARPIPVMTSFILRAQNCFKAIHATNNKDISFPCMPLNIQQFEKCLK